LRETARLEQKEALIVSELKSGVALLKSEPTLYSPPQSVAKLDSK
jgi:hypothetical protein